MGVGVGVIVVAREGYRLESHVVATVAAEKEATWESEARIHMDLNSAPGFQTEDSCRAAFPFDPTSWRSVASLSSVTVQLSFADGKLASTEALQSYVLAPAVTSWIVVEPRIEAAAVIAKLELKLGYLSC